MLASIGWALSLPGDATGESPAVSELVVASGPHHLVFRVEVAATADERRQGLQHRHTLGADAGMLFLYDSPKRAVMWMRNTYLPLDMLFIDDRGVINQIVAGAAPRSERRIHSQAVVSAVLELPGGTCSRHGIQPGDRVIHPALVKPAVPGGQHTIAH